MSYGEMDYACWRQISGLDDRATTERLVGGPTPTMLRPQVDLIRVPPEQFPFLQPRLMDE